MAPLMFRPDGSFSIVQFTDTHLQDMGPADIDTLALIARAVEWEQPDLIVLTGDIVHPTWSADPLATWRRLIAHLDQLDLPWTFVYGNHDAEEFDPDSIDDVLATSARCMYEPGPRELHGHGNYYLPIMDRRGESVSAAVWSVDSGRDSDGTLSGWGYVHEDQVAWFRGEADRLADGAPSGVVGLLFVHNPVPQFETVWNTQTCVGRKYEGICFQGMDTGLFDAMKGRAAGCFVGHDHVNDFEGELDGVGLIFGRCTGYNCYGAEGFLRGARLIRLTEGVAGYSTHVRLEDGTVADMPVHNPGEPVTSPPGTSRPSETE